MEATRQPDNHQPSQSVLHMQMILKCTPATQYVELTRKFSPYSVVLMAHTKLLSGVQLRHSCSTTCDIVMAGGCLVVI